MLPPLKHFNSQPFLSHPDWRKNEQNVFFFTFIKTWSHIKEQYDEQHRQHLNHLKNDVRARNTQRWMKLQSSLIHRYFYLYCRGGRVLVNNKSPLLPCGSILASVKSPSPQWKSETQTLLTVDAGPCLHTEKMTGVNKMPLPPLTKEDWFLDLSWITLTL